MNWASHCFSALVENLNTIITEVKAYCNSSCKRHHFINDMIQDDKERILSKVKFKFKETYI
ncbi:hypothetical protein T11_1574 [Trichinella zimbabwensis]|uniref:Uncharacterized protein n=1 Tax=Trichinella zimbabwensis TaxID=268475 RepID=A0A0V1HNG2_9BILA|nr:hypothetical protein T11_1574 [Trichinella zimbabwensis]